MTAIKGRGYVHSLFFVPMTSVSYERKRGMEDAITTDQIKANTENDTDFTGGKPAPVRQVARQMQMYSVSEALKVMSIGKTFFYAQVKEGKVKCAKAGRKTLVSEQAIQDWLAALPSLSGQNEGGSEDARPAK